jgi:hypothetical protein
VRQVHVGARTDGELVVELELVLTPLNDFAVVEQHTVVMHAAPVGAYADPIEAQVRHHLSLEVRAGERLLDTVPDPVLAHLDLPAEAMAADTCTGETWVGVEERPGCGRKSADARVRRWRGESEGVTQGGGQAHPLRRARGAALVGRATTLLVGGRATLLIGRATLLVGGATLLVGGGATLLVDGHAPEVVLTARGQLHRCGDTALPRCASGRTSRRALISRQPSAHKQVGCAATRAGAVGVQHWPCAHCSGRELEGDPRHLATKAVRVSRNA